MRSLWRAVLFAPVLATALVLPEGNFEEQWDNEVAAGPTVNTPDHTSVHIGVDVSPAHDGERGRLLGFALEVLRSEEACGHGNVTLNDQVLPQTFDGSVSYGKGSLKSDLVDRQSIILANWAFHCIKVNGVPDSQLMKLNVEVVDGKAVKDIGFSVLFQQSGDAKILKVDTNLSVPDEVIANPNPQGLRPAKEDKHPHLTIEEQITELDYLWSQLREIKYLIHQRERALAHDANAHYKVDLSDCDSLKCVVKAIANNANDAVDKLYGKFRGDDEAHQGRWGRPHHKGHADRPLGEHSEHKGNHTHGEHPPHGPGNHTHIPHGKRPYIPHLPLPVCRYPPPPPRGHHRGPPRGGPPHHNGPPPHHDDPEFRSFHHRRPKPKDEKHDFRHHSDGGERPHHPDGDEHMPPPPAFDGPEHEGHHMRPSPPPFHEGTGPEDNMLLPPLPDFDGPNFDHPGPPRHDGPESDRPPPPPEFDGPPPHHGDDGPQGPPGDRHHGPPPFGPGHRGPNHLGRALQVVKFTSIGFLFAFLLLALHRRNCTPQRRADRQARREERHRRRAYRRAAHKHLITRLLARMSGDDEDEEDEEKERLLEDADDGQNTTMTEEIVEFRNAADVVEEIVIATAPASSTTSVTESEPLLTPVSTEMSNTDLELASSAVYGYSEELPAYEDNDGSDMSSIISDGYRPGQMGNYVPSHSPSGSVSDILGPDTKS